MSNNAKLYNVNFRLMDNLTSGSLDVAYLQAGVQKESITQSSEGPLFKGKANSTCANVLTPQRIFMDTLTQQAHYIEEVCSHLVGTTCQFVSLIITTFLKVHTSIATGSKELCIKKGAPRQAGTLLFLWCKKSLHTNYV